MIVSGAEAALGVLALALACCGVRLALGPTLADRIVALDAGALVLINIILTVGVLLATRVFLDVAVVLAALLFVGTVAVAHFIRTGGPFA